MKILVYAAVLQESLRFAFQSIKANLLRTLLSLLGVTIGVFCIISILTLIDSIEYNIRNSLSQFGDDVIFVQKWPWGFQSDYPFWKYANRPEMKFREMQQLEKRFSGAEAISYNVWVPNRKVSLGTNAVENVMLRAVTQDYEKIVALDYETGRFFTETEAHRGEPVIVLGYDLATNLFGSAAKALNNKVDAMDRKMRVIGVLQKQGNELGVGGNQDKQAIIPYEFLRTLGSFEQTEYGPTILVKSKKGVSLDVLEDELRGVMRSIRRLSPRQEDNFAINKITLFSTFLNDIFSKINLYGWVIAGFSILVGGFGIANIMFVSVKERTPIIGIQKALGAKRIFIMVQFLGEAVLLCLLGGIIGLLLILLLTSLLNLVMPFTIILNMKNVLTGLGISSLIGIISGYIPSRQAARMDPIEAIRSVA